MAKKTVRKNNNGVEVVAGRNEFLEYRMKIKGARANFAWADDNETVVLTHNDFGLVDEIQWQLKVALTAEGKVKVTVPQKPGYERLEDAGKTTDYSLTLAFVTASAYTLTVRRCKADGTTVSTPKDLDYAMERTGESVNEGLFVGLEGQQ